MVYHNQKVYRYIQHRHLLALVYPTQAVRFWRFKKDCAAWPVNKWFSHWRNQVVHMVSQCAFRCGVKEGVQLDGMHLFLTDWCRNCSLFRTVCHYSIEFCPGSGSVTIFCVVCTPWTLGVTRFLQKETIFSEVFASDWEIAIVNAADCADLLWKIHWIARAFRDSWQDCWNERSIAHLELIASWMDCFLWKKTDWRWAVSSLLSVHLNKDNEDGIIDEGEGDGDA